jgi:hypothetical protein
MGIEIRNLGSGRDEGKELGEREDACPRNEFAVRLSLGDLYWVPNIRREECI